MKGKIQDPEGCVSSSSHACILRHPLSSFVAFFPNRMPGLWRLGRQSVIISRLLSLPSPYAFQSSRASGCFFPWPNSARKSFADLFIYFRAGNNHGHRFLTSGAARFLSSKSGRASGDLGFAHHLQCQGLGT